MKWADFHTQSQVLAAQAEASLRSNDLAAAQQLYREAADAERSALQSLGPSKRRTIGIAAVSAVALYYKARAYPEAEKLAYEWLPKPHLPEFAVKQLRDLLQLIWSDAAIAAGPIRFIPGDVLVSVRGGEIVLGGAPLDLIVRKVSEVEKLFYRVAEYLLGRPHRIRGEPPREVKAMVRPWLFQAAPGSYQFMVRVQEPPQTDLFADDFPKVSQVARTFLNVVRATASDPEGVLPQLVSEPQYRRTFLRMTRNLAPTGKTFDRLDIREATQSPGDAISLASPVRSELNATLKRAAEPREEGELREIRGVLRALHLDKQWLEVADPENPQQHTRIQRTSEALDDIIGPMVNHTVLVETLVDRHGRHLFRDIQLEE